MRWSAMFLEAGAARRCRFYHRKSETRHPRGLTSATASIIDIGRRLSEICVPLIYVRVTPVRAAALTVLAVPTLPVHPAVAQRTYLLEAGAAGTFLSFDGATDLGTGPGGLVRLGLWLPFKVSLEGEGAILKPKTSSALGVDVKTLSGSALFNVMLGGNNSIYLKGGVGSTTYGGTCPSVAVPGSGPCGTATTWIGGLGFRVGIVPTVMLRGEGVVNRNSSGQLKFSNFGGNLGLSVMLGSRQTTERGVPRPVVSPSPTLRPSPPVEQPAAPPSAPILCHDTPPGAVLDASGCPIDSDGDGVPDGIDQCPDTPKGATVDALGCPADSDGDGVLDGLDRCPNTPPGTPVDAFGCPVAQPSPVAPEPAVSARRSFVLRDNAFAAGTARLRPGASVSLDSVAAVLAADPRLSVEIRGYTARSRSEVDTPRFVRLRATAIRAYLIAKGIRPQRLVPKVYGAAQPLTADTSATGRAINRRIEIRLFRPGP